MRLLLIALLGFSLSAHSSLAQQTLDRQAAEKTSPTAAPKKSPSEVVEKARVLLVEGDDLEAISLLDEVLRSKTDLTPEVRAMALYLRGVAFYKEDNAFAALRDLRAAASEPHLPGPMQKSAATASRALTGQISSVVGGVHGEGYSYEVRLTIDDLRQQEKQIEENRSDIEPEDRSDQFATLAHEYASRGQFDGAKRLAARSFAEAKASGSDFRIGAAYMTSYEIAQMQGDTRAAATALNQALRIFEDRGMLRTAPGFLADLINKSESRGHKAETCRHRQNLNDLYARIEGDDLKEDAERNLAAMRRQDCSSL